MGKLTEEAPWAGPQAYRVFLWSPTDRVVQFSGLLSFFFHLGVNGVFATQGPKEREGETGTDSMQFETLGTLETMLMAVLLPLVRRMMVTQSILKQAGARDSNMERGAGGGRRNYAVRHITQKRKPIRERYHVVCKKYTKRHIQSMTAYRGRR